MIRSAIASALVFGVGASVGWTWSREIARWWAVPMLETYASMEFWDQLTLKDGYHSKSGRVRIAVLGGELCLVPLACYLLWSLMTSHVPATGRRFVSLYLLCAVGTLAVWVWGVVGVIGPTLVRGLETSPEQFPIYDSNIDRYPINVHFYVGFTSRELFKLTPVLELPVLLVWLLSVGALRPQDRSYG